MIFVLRIPYLLEMYDSSSLSRDLYGPILMPLPGVSSGPTRILKSLPIVIWFGVYLFKGPLFYHQV